MRSRRRLPTIHPIVAAVLGAATSIGYWVLSFISATSRVAHVLLGSFWLLFTIGMIVVIVGIRRAGRDRSDS